MLGDLLHIHALAVFSAWVAHAIVTAVSQVAFGWWAAAAVCCLFATCLLRRSLLERADEPQHARLLLWLGVMPQLLALLICAYVAVDS